MEPPATPTLQRGVPRERVNPFLGRPISEWAEGSHVLPRHVASSQCGTGPNGSMHTEPAETLGSEAPPLDMANDVSTRPVASSSEEMRSVAGQPDAFTPPLPDAPFEQVPLSDDPLDAKSTISGFEPFSPASEPVTCESGPVSMPPALYTSSPPWTETSPASLSVTCSSGLVPVESCPSPGPADQPLQSSRQTLTPLTSPSHLAVVPWPAADLNSSGDEDWERRPPAERWAPLGANDADDEQDSRDAAVVDDHRRASFSSTDLSRLRKLEEEQEHLNNSLMALTTHFAQVQFRLRQIVEAPAEEKEQLLQDLETFAFRGIPDVRQYKLAEQEERQLSDEWKHQEMVETQRLRQRDLMQQLKAQLEDLEHYAYETGEAGLPSSVVLEKQRVIIDELKGKLNIDIDNLDRMTSEDLKSLVDCAVGQLINPLKMKEQLVNQLKTQVQDLERFISFLQGDAEDGGCDGSCRAGRGPQPPTSSGDESAAGRAEPPPRLRRRSARQRAQKQQEMHNEASTMMQKALTLLQLVTLTQFGCGGHHFQSNELKKTPRGNHWGDLRARLELAVSAVSELAKASLKQQQCSEPGTDDSECEPPSARGEQLTLAVRKELAAALRDLVQHGLLQMSKSRSVVPFAGCLSARSASPRLLHAWDLVLVYYRLKRGAQFNATPQRKLSQSFALDVVGGTAITNKHTLLSSIGNIIASHTPLKRSADAHFKAFVCAGLNARKLSSWLRLILRTQAVTEEYYQPWSYVVSTGFDDALGCLARLEKHRFQLPEDLAVRQLKSIRDAF